MKQIKLLTVCVAFALGGVPASHSYVMDMANFTCEQLLQGGTDATEQTIWLSGFYNGLHQNTNVDLSQMQHNVEIVKGECRANPNKTVMEIIDTILSQQK